MLKSIAVDNSFSWIKRKIHVSDGYLYQDAVLQTNIQNGNIFSEHFIKDFPFDDEIKITPLGGETTIGASCFILSYKGYNIMLDCGINPQKQGDEAYPHIDRWNGSVDAIIISHAHIDHSGGVPKAHAMWPDAEIIATAPTKVFLKYLYSDMAKISNGITDDFEIENIYIEKEVVIDTLKSISTVNYEEWISISKDIKIRLHPAGHIIGAAMIEITICDKTILYTGDYCNNSQILSSNYKLNYLPQNVDYLISELTYLKKGHINWNNYCCELKSAITAAINQRKSIILPSASVGRSQELVCIIGEMKLSNEIPDSVNLYLAGMAIPATTQLIPFMNKQYEHIVNQFIEVDSTNYPGSNSIVIASSGTMSRGSASYKIAKRWADKHIPYHIIANGFLDEDSEANTNNVDRYSSVQHISLPSHTDIDGISELINYVSPKVLSFVHKGSGTTDEMKSVLNLCKNTFSNDILLRKLSSDKTESIFDMYEWQMKGEL